MPPLNPVVASAPHKESKSENAIKLERSEPSSVKNGHRQSADAADSESMYTQEINANLLPFPNEESFHLPEPATEANAVDKVDNVSVKDRLNLYCYIRKGDFDIVWTNVTVFGIAHLIHVFTLYNILTSSDPRVLKTWIFSYWVGVVGGLGITAGAHRLWSHKSYKAKLPLRIFLMIGQCIAGQNSLYIWCRDHRVHHKFSETDGDPHNTNRGFFFAHVGWLLRKKHPLLKERCKKLDFTDLLADPVVRFQKNHYPALYLAFAVFGPCLIPMALWQMSLMQCLTIVYVTRYITSLHSTWFVNSTAHMFGDKPYNKYIEARENPFVSFGAFGEGYHNYHHTFPFDYATSELGCRINVTKKFIDLMASIGQVYDRKQMSQSLVDNRKRENISS